MDVSREKQKERNNFGSERYEKSEFQDKVRQQFEKLGAEPDTKDIWHIID